MKYEKPTVEVVQFPDEIQMTDLDGQMIPGCGLYERIVSSQDGSVEQKQTDFLRCTYQGCEMSMKRVKE